MYSEVPGSCTRKVYSVPVPPSIRHSTETPTTKHELEIFIKN